MFMFVEKYQFYVNWQWRESKKVQQFDYLMMLIDLELNKK